VQSSKNLVLATPIPPLSNTHQYQTITGNQIYDKNNYDIWNLNTDNIPTDECKL